MRGLLGNDVEEPPFLGLGQHLIPRYFLKPREARIRDRVLFKDFPIHGQIECRLREDEDLVDAAVRQEPLGLFGPPLTEQFKVGRMRTSRSQRLFPSLVILTPIAQSPSLWAPWGGGVWRSADR